MGLKLLYYRIFITESEWRLCFGWDPEPKVLGSEPGVRAKNTTHISNPDVACKYFWFIIGDTFYS